MSDCIYGFSETDIIKMLELLIDSICVMFGGHVFQQIVSILMGTNCLTVTPSRRLVILFVRGRFLTGVSKKNEKKLPYIDGVLSLNNSTFGDFVDRIYHIELEIKDTTDTVKSSSYLDLQLEIGSDAQLKRNFTTKESILISTL